MSRCKNKPDEQHPCRWTEDEDGNWETACGQMFCFIEGGPQDNRMVFCCYCGKLLVEVKAKAALEGDDE